MQHSKYKDGSLHTASWHPFPLGLQKPLYQAELILTTYCLVRWRTYYFAHFPLSFTVHNLLNLTLVNLYCSSIFHLWLEIKSLLRAVLLYADLQLGGASVSLIPI